jgi:copper chaperone NosL
VQLETVMRTGTLMAAAAAAVLTAACGVTAEGPPDIAVDRTPCAHCGMLISEPVYAAAYRTPQSESLVFDDIGCLLKAAAREPRADALRFWFHDAATAVWIDGTDAVFVSSRALRTPMGGGLVAYRDRAAAREAAVRQQGSVVPSLTELLNRPIQGAGDSLQETRRP